jgi:hypothetical protein
VKHIPPSARVVVLALLLSALGQTARAEDAEAPGYPQVPGFVCLGESEALLRGTSLSEIRQEIDKRLRWIDEGKIPKGRLAHTHCTVAELMRRTGDGRADENYRKAIALNPREPAYELWYARYHQWSRGAGASNAKGTSDHGLAALDKLETFKGITQTGSTDDVTRQWSQRQLLTLTQEDGLPLLPWNAYPFEKRKPNYPQLYIAAYGDYAKDTNDFWDFADTRKLTTEAQVAADRAIDTNHVLSKDELLEILRAPKRYDAYGRLRLRQTHLGTLDFHYRRAKLFDSQIISFGDVGYRTDVDLEEFGAVYRRTITIPKAFDLTLDGSYARQSRKGVVETWPDTIEHLNVYVGSATVSRFIGPDKLSIGGTYVYFDTPDRPEPALDESDRVRTMRAGFIDYAIYRPLRLPFVSRGTLTTRRTYSRGWHWFGSFLLDDERFGNTIVKRRTYGGGTTLKGMQGYDVGVYGTYMYGGQELNQRNLGQLDNSQWRSAVRLMKRLVDEDVTPGIPTSVLTSLNVNLAARHDMALTGQNNYENFRVTGDVWAKLLVLPMRGTSFLLSGSVSYQYFYRLDTGMVLGQITARMGWPSFGTLLAY